MRGAISAAIKNVAHTLNRTPAMIIIASTDDSNIHDEGQPDWANPLGIAKVLTEWQPASAELQEKLGLTVGEQRYKVFLPYRVFAGLYRLRINAPVGSEQDVDSASITEIPELEQTAAGKFGDTEYSILHADWWPSHTRCIVELMK